MDASIALLEECSLSNAIRELKRRLKVRAKEAAKAEKAASTPANGDAKKNKDEDGVEAQDDAIPEDPRLYFENRSRLVQKLRESQAPAPYPHKFSVDISLPHFIDKYGALADGERSKDVIHIAGRLHNIRSSSKNLIFYDLHAEGVKVQIMAAAQDSERDFQEAHGLLQRGDIVGVKGYPGKSKRGELSIFPLDVTLLTPCLRMLPKAHYGLKDQEVRYRMRYLDLIMNAHVRDKFVVRAKIINYLRKFLDNLGFLEVETPMMNMIAGGMYFLRCLF